MERVPLTFRPSAQPLAPAAAIAHGPAARALAKRLLQYTDEELRTLRGVAGPDGLFLMGEEAQLPWVDGIVYLARSGGALFVPTNLALNVAADLVERSICRVSATKAEAYVLLAGPPRVLALSSLHEVRRDRLAEWLGQAP